MSNYSYEPYIIKETCNGITYHRIRDEMFQQREIECVGEIDGDSVNSLISQLRFLARADGEKEITIYINCPGGMVEDGLALYDVMKAISCPVRTVCVGLAASMGAILFAAGDRREMLPHSRVMIHDPLIRTTGGNALKLREISDGLLRSREILCGILAEHTGRTVEEIYEKTAKDSYFSAEEAVEFGLADRIIDRI